MVRHVQHHLYSFRVSSGGIMAVFGSFMSTSAANGSYPEANSSCTPDPVSRITSRLGMMPGSEQHVAMRKTLSVAKSSA